MEALPAKLPQAEVERIRNLLGVGTVKSKFNDQGQFCLVYKLGKLARREDLFWSRYFLEFNPAVWQVELTRAGALGVRSPFNRDRMPDFTFPTGTIRQIIPELSGLATVDRDGFVILKAQNEPHEPRVQVSPRFADCQVHQLSFGTGWLNEHYDTVVINLNKELLGRRLVPFS